jgi:cytochrome c oxidase cbb3-type subunit III
MKRDAALLLVVALLAGACEREARKLSKEPTPQLATSSTEQPQSGVQPGAQGPGLREIVPTRSFDPGNAWELSQGKRLYRWYNCSGCHGGGGGGGMGPALMDDRWIYGHEPDQIFRSIMEGRPKGMPSFKGRIPEEQAWQLVGYVRSMSGLAPENARTMRSDALGGAYKPENERPTGHPTDAPPKD